MQNSCIKMFYKIWGTDRHSCKNALQRHGPFLNAINFNQKMNATISFLNEDNLSLISLPRFMRFSLYFSEAYQQI